MSHKMFTKVTFYGLESTMACYGLESTTPKFINQSQIVDKPQNHFKYEKNKLCDFVVSP